jgi:hypothetical protein
MRSALIIFAGLFGYGAVLTQAQQMAGPASGFLFDAPTRSLRAVTGSPGAALFGPALFSDADYGSVAPRRDYALVRRRDGLLLVRNLGSPSVAAVSISGLPAVPEGVSWSADGSVALLYSRIENWIQQIANLPDSPTLGPVLSISPLGGTLAALAVGPHGDQIAVAVSGASSSVYELTNGQNFIPLPFAPEPVALAFSADGGTLYGASAGQLIALNTQDLTAQSWPLDLQDPVAVTASSDPQSRKVYVAAGDDRMLIALDGASGQAVAGFDLSFEPTALEALGSAAFVLRPRASGQDPLWSFVNFPQGTVYFVPALPPAPRRERPR